MNTKQAIWLAELSAGKHTFRATGETKEKAVGYAAVGWREHAKSCGTSMAIDYEDIKVFNIPFGACFRDSVLVLN